MNGLKVRDKYDLVTRASFVTHITMQINFILSISLIKRKIQAANKHTGKNLYEPYIQKSINISNELLSVTLWLIITW